MDTIVERLEIHIPDWCDSWSSRTVLGDVLREQHTMCLSMTLMRSDMICAQIADLAGVASLANAVLLLRCLAAKLLQGRPFMPTSLDVWASSSAQCGAEEHLWDVVY